MTMADRSGLGQQGENDQAHDMLASMYWENYTWVSWHKEQIQTNGCRLLGHGHLDLCTYRVFGKYAFFACK